MRLSTWASELQGEVQPDRLALSRRWQETRARFLLQKPHFSFIVDLSFEGSYRGGVDLVIWRRW